MHSTIRDTTETHKVKYDINFNRANPDLYIHNSEENLSEYITYYLVENEKFIHK